MTLDTGTRLGPYEIETPIGAGGMGEVYRAKDTRLERVVAIKVLPTHFSERTDLKQRFDREAKVISNLSHPNICALFDVGHENGVDFLVMEYLEGDSLADRLSSGPLPLEETLRIAVQVAQALDAAHRDAVVHRDLKPANVMLTKSGAKLLDFGLAKIGEVDGSDSSSLTALPTALPTAASDKPLTTAGTVLGTFQYMAPEQLEGQEADARSDIFAFGTLLYEMATGNKAFEGKSQASLIAAILERDPAPISAAQPMSPPALDRLVKRCLAKDPDDRWQTARDLALELAWIAEGGSSAGLPAPVTARRKKRERVWMGSTAILALITLALAAAFFLRPTPPSPVTTRSSLLAPEGMTLLSAGFGAGPLAVSPDGSHVVFVAREDGPKQLFVRSLDAMDARPLPGTEGASRPFWSFDSRYVGFFADQKLKKIAIGGGPALTICSVTGDGRGGTWNEEDTIIFSGFDNEPLQKVAAAGGEPMAITERDSLKGEQTHRYPYFLPDGKRYLFLSRSPAMGTEERLTITYLGTLGTVERREVLRVNSNVQYASGHLLFVRERTLMAQPFDPGKAELTGDAFPIAEGVQHDTAFSRGVFSVSRNGVLAYQTGEAWVGSEFVWYERDGTEKEIIGEPGLLFDQAFSPDETRVAMGIFDPETSNADIWIQDLTRGLRTRFTFANSRESSPEWSPDGKHLVFGSTRKVALDICLKATSGVGKVEIIFESPREKHPTSWSRDGRHILFRNLGTGATKIDIGLLTLTAETWEFTPFLETPFNEDQAVFSPDGKWVAYESDASGPTQVYVTSFPEKSSVWQISKTEGRRPSWRGDGKELYFASEGRIMATEISPAADALHVGATRPLFTSGPRAMPTADGTRFLVNRTLTTGSNTPITLVLNWTADVPE